MQHPRSGETAWLVLLKAGLSSDDARDVAPSAEAHPAFPQESTTNQIHSEEQRKSYRAWGNAIRDAVIL